ncbi:unnamed protein product, partial [Ectocarpus sp. 12 AP-2014]
WDEVGELQECVGFLRKTTVFQSGQELGRIPVACRVIGFCRPQQKWRPGDAVPLFGPALGIEEAKLGPDDVGVANTLSELARNVRYEGRPRDAVPLFERALGIKE